MPVESAKLLHDMLVAARGVRSIVEGRTIEEHRTDLQLRWAVERGFEIIGEALSQLRKIDQSMAESISDYRAIIGFRNVLIHGYSVVSADKTWDVAVSELPTLIRELELLLS